MTREATGSWTKWARYAAIGAALLVSVPSASAEPAHFRGPHAYSHVHAHAHAVVRHPPHVQHPLSNSVGHRRLDANATVNAAVDKANEIGSSVRKAIKQLRGGTDDFYRDLIDAIKIQLCDQLVQGSDQSKNPWVRFVDANDELAYKDSDGNCIKITSPSDQTVKDAYSQGQCEVKPNCYWAEIEPTDTGRKPVYSITEAEMPKEGAMSLQESEDVLMKWAQGLMIFVVPGIILAVLSLLTMILFLLCRCCCNRCGGRSPKEGGYTCMQKFYPVLFFLLFSGGIFAVAGSSLLYQKSVSGAVSDMFDAVANTLDGANGWVGNIKTPLVGIRDKVIDTADDIKTELAGTDFIETGLDGLVGELKEFGGYSAGRTLPDGCTIDPDDKYCLPCQVCTTISTEVSNAADEIETNAGDGVAQLKEVRSSLTDKLVDIATSVKTTVDDVVDMLATFTSTITDAKGQVTDVQDQYEKQKQAQQFGVLAPFVLAIVVVAIGFIGVLFGLTPLKFLAFIIHIAYILGFLALFITFLLAAIFLAVSVVLGDVCEVAAIFTEDWTVALGDEAKGINACFQNTSLIETLSLSDSLEFARGGIKFPDNMNINDMLDFSQLDTFNATIMSTNTSTFQLNATARADVGTIFGDLVNQNAASCTPSDTYTTDTEILEPWTANGEQQNGKTPEQYIEDRYSAMDTDCDYASNPNAKAFKCKDDTGCTYSKAVKEVYLNLRSIVLIERDSGAFIDDLHANMTGVMTYTDDFKTKISDFDGKISNIKTDLEGSLLKNVDDFEAAMYCTFISDGFFDIYDALCGDLMPSFTMISLMIFLAGVFLIPVNICLIIAVKRLRARGNGGHVMDNEMKFK